MPSKFQIRRCYPPTDLLQILALNDRVQPYRQEDQPEVEEMFERARAEQHNAQKTVPIPSSGPSIEQIDRDFLSFWVAVPEADEGQIVGMVGVGPLNPEMMPEQNPYAQALRKRQDFVELQYLRVSPEARGYGIGIELCKVVIDWSRQAGYQMLLVNTTAPQHPARALYAKLGFEEKERTYVGLYELVWMEKLLAV